jgi:TRAP-type transport system periplasmic protein
MRVGSTLSANGWKSPPGAARARIERFRQEEMKMSNSPDVRRPFLAVTMLLCWAVLAASPAQADTYRWQFTNAWPAKHPATGALQGILDGIRDRSDGRLQIEMVHLDAIGFKQADLLRVMRQGVSETGLFVPYYVRRDAPKLANVVPTGGLTDPEDNLLVADLQRAYADRILREDWGVVLATRFFNRGGRELVLVSRDEVNSLAGLQGRKLRHFEALGLRAFERLGIAAQTLPQAELYLALRTGVVDAAIHGLTNTAAQSIQEVACCYADLTPFPGQGAPYGIMVRAELWEQLPEDLKAVMRDVTEEDWAVAVEEWRAGVEDKAAKEQLAAGGMKELPPVSAEDRKTLQAAVFEVWKEESEKLGADAVELYEEVVRVLGAR